MKLVGDGMVWGERPPGAILDMLNLRCPLGIQRASMVVQMIKNHLQCRRPGFDSWVRNFPGERNGNPLQYSGLGNCMERGVWHATVHGVTESDMTE